MKQKYLDTLLSLIATNEPSLKKIDLSSERFNNKQLKSLVDALKTNKTVTDIKLHYNDFGDDSAKFIAELLKNNQTINRLEIEHNKIGAEGVKYISDALKTNKTVTDINLRYNDFDDDSAKFIAELLENNQTITDIELGGNRIGAKGAKYISDALKTNKTVTDIKLSYNNFGDDGAKSIAELLEQNKAIKQLELDGNKIGAKGAKYISDALIKNTTVTRLTLGDNNFGDDGAKSIAKLLENNQTITDLELSNNGIGAEDSESAKDLCAALIKNTTVTRLMLGYLSSEDEGEEDDEDNQIIKMHNQFDGGGAGALAEMLKKNKTIKSIVLDYLELGTDDVKDITDAWKDNNTLTDIRFGSNQLGSKGLNYVVDALKNNTTIKAIHLGNNEIGDGDIDPNKDDANGSAKIEHLAKMLETNKILTSVDLPGNKITDKDAERLLQAVQNNRTLTNLFLEHPYSNPYSSSDGRYLRNDNNILQINTLTNNNAIKMKYFTIEEIKKYLPKKHVDLSKMKYFTIEEIKKYLPKKHVDLSKMKYFTDENAKFITDLYKKYYMTVPVTLPKNKYKIHITCDSQYVPKKNEIIFYINGTTITTNRREYGGNFRTLPNADPMHSVITQMSGKDVTPSKYNNLMSELMHSKFLLYDLELGSHFYMDDLSQQKIDKVIKNNIAKFNELFGLISAINGRLLNVKGDTNLNTTNNDYIYAIAPFIVGKGGKKITDYLCTEVANKIKTKLISDNPNSFQSENEKKRKIEDQKDNNSEKKQKTEDPKDPQEEHVSKTQKRI